MLCVSVGSNEFFINSFIQICSTLRNKPPSGDNTMFLKENFNGTVVLSDLWNLNLDKSVTSPAFVSI